MINFEAALAALADAGVQFVIVGGLAGTAHGSALLTKDLDICYERTADNHKRLAALLQKIHARLRDAPGSLPFVLDERALSQGMNFTLQTDLGDIDLLGELSGGGRFSELMRDAMPMLLYGKTFQVASLDALIRSKRAAGRPKDMNALPELEALRDLTRRRQP